MLRDRSLIPLSHQHHNGLALCVLTDQALRADQSDENVRRLAARIVERYDIELVNHFEIEEQVLFPRLGAVQPTVDRLVAEHAQLTAMVEDLRERPAADTLRSICALLRTHIRSEENELFEAAQKILNREELDQIGATIDARAVRVCL